MITAEMFYGWRKRKGRDPISVMVGFEGDLILRSFDKDVPFSVHVCPESCFVIFSYYKNLIFPVYLVWKRSLLCPLLGLGGPVLYYFVPLYDVSHPSSCCHYDPSQNATISE